MGHRCSTAVGPDEPLRCLAEMLLVLEQQAQLQSRLGAGVHSLAEVALGEVVESLADGIEAFLQASLRRHTERQQQEISEYECFSKHYLT